MLAIEHSKVISGTARCFPAIGGGYAVKMRMRLGGELLFGSYPSKDTALRVVDLANKMKDGVASIAEIESRAAAITEEPSHVERVA